MTANAERICEEAEFTVSQSGNLDQVEEIKIAE